MILVVCVDDNNGMSFNGRRQSRDSELIKRIENMGRTIWLHPDSAILFNESAYPDADFLNKAGADELCFTENELPPENKVDKLILYRWNRSYPYDTEFTFKLSSWSLISSDEFVGSSHEKITEEVYVR